MNAGATIQPGQFIVGGDLGGTRFRAVLADHQGNVVERVSTLTRAAEGRDAVIGRILEHVRRLGDIAGAGNVAGIGIGAPGPLNPWTGVVLSPPNLPGWIDVPLQKILEDAFGAPAWIDNDANLAALAENRFGAARGASSLVYITVSTGIGGGVIDRGRLIRGATGQAGEIGHSTIVPDGPRCGCGNLGCLEALAAGPAIARAAAELLRAGAPSSLRAASPDPDAVTTELVVQAAERGDALALDVLTRAATYLGIGVATVVALFNPEIVVLGGGVTNAGELLFAPVRREVDRRTMPSMRQGLRIVRAELADDVVLLGAVALVMTELQHAAP